MRVLFIFPTRDGTGNISLNLPLLIAVTKRAGHDVRLFDFQDYNCFQDKFLEDRSVFFKEAPLKSQRIIQDRKAFYGRGFGQLVDGFGLKATEYREDFDSLLREFRPDLIAVSAVSMDFEFACDFLAPFKEKYGIPVIFGGVHAILLPEEAISQPVIDYICVGEGEVCFPQFLDSLTSEPC
ncbi:MAG: cobalamin-dependent protein [Deltaproteobacteria bacterium]|nr:cobalamin-dependent protein [Deltaproteobacteria bacterium]